jgi:hypothetical protein
MGFEAMISPGERRLVIAVLLVVVGRAAGLVSSWLRIPWGHEYLSFVSDVCCEVEISVMSNSSKLFYRIIMDEKEIQRFNIREEMQRVQMFQCCGITSYSASPTST